MTRLASLTLGLLCLAAGVAAGYLAWPRTPQNTPPLLPAPGLHPDRSVHDFGTLGQFETVSTEFRITNHFTEAVTVLDVLKSCSCAEAVMTPRTLLPGGS